MATSDSDRGSMARRVSNSSAVVEESPSNEALRYCNLEDFLEHLGVDHASAGDWGRPVPGPDLPRRNGAGSRIVEREEPPSRNKRKTQIRSAGSRSSATTTSLDQVRARNIKGKLGWICVAKEEGKAAPGMLAPPLLRHPPAVLRLADH
ncbi:unnamed protein product [Symbiodinium sp. CCMP2592]|nr:unnamed protein product [Symbiodinium sp. CCMP2592]